MGIVSAQGVRGTGVGSSGRESLVEWLSCLCSSFSEEEFVTQGVGGLGCRLPHPPSKQRHSRRGQ